MTLTPEKLTDCRFCSLVSKANGEDPIGSAPLAQHWLVVELPQPWSAQVFQEDPSVQPVFALIKTLVLRGIKLRPIAIAPDRAYSQPGYRRVLYYRQATSVFSEFEAHEYLVPEAEVMPLAIALLKRVGERGAIASTNDLAPFEPYRQINQTRDLLICTHGNVDAACARFGFPIYDKLRQDFSGDRLRIWRCTHFGGHQYAPTLVDLPSGRYWGHLELEMLDALVHQQGTPSDLYAFYRGWAGLGKFEQIAEREIWMKEGWDWLSYAKRGKVVKLGEPQLKSLLRRLLQWIPSQRLQLFLEHSKQDAKWAVVRIEYQSMDGLTMGVYQGRVALSGQILTAIRSAKQMDLVPVNQYQVTELIRLV
ncbi:MAG: sucrase ferredoxin [Leptolyngbyaceae cyanobacterium CSU_1_4]|nr:sucrase ferredoxin [Leptolyngbyaceae cyanobacterium CSU_1_4]